MADPLPRVNPSDRTPGGGSGGRARATAAKSGPPGRRPKRGGMRGAFRGLLKLGLLLFLWIAILGGGTIAYFAYTLPDTDQLMVATRRPSVTILAADGSLISTFGDLFGQPLSLKEMSPYLPK